MVDAGSLSRLRWVGPLWLAVYVPSYTAAYGVLNFLFLCNLGVLLTAVGLLRRSALLLSTQALAALVVCLAWILDFGGRLVLGHHPLGVTACMWDPQYPLFTRLLSLYHTAWPFVLLAALRQVGYDRRAFAVQSALAAVVIPLSRVAGPSRNVNYAYQDPLFHVTFHPAALHLLVVVGAAVALAYWPTHALLRRSCPPPPTLLARDKDPEKDVQDRPGNDGQEAEHDPQDPDYRGTPAVGLRYATADPRQDPMASRSTQGSRSHGASPFEHSGSGARCPTERHTLRRPGPFRRGSTLRYDEAGGSRWRESASRGADGWWESLRIRTRAKTRPRRSAITARAPASAREPRTTPMRSKVGFSTLIQVIVSVTARLNFFSSPSRSL